MRHRVAGSIEVVTTNMDGTLGRGVPVLSMVGTLNQGGETDSVAELWLSAFEDGLQLHEVPRFARLLAAAMSGAVISWLALQEDEMERQRRPEHGEDRKGGDEEQARAGVVHDDVGAGMAAIHRMAGHGTHDLGHLDKPGAVLRNHVQKLAPGETLRFTTSVNQIWGVGEAHISPSGRLKYASKELAPNQAHVLGSQSQQEYTFTMPKDGKHGESFQVTFPGHYQVRSDPNWAFSFHINCG